MPDQVMLGFADNLGSAPYSRSALRAARDLVPPGWRLEIFDTAGIPPFSTSPELPPRRVVVQLKREVRAADAILLVTREVDYAPSAVLRNLIDWASVPHGENAWRYKPVAILGIAAFESDKDRAPLGLHQLCVSVGMLPVNRPPVTITEAARRFDARRELVDVHARDLVRMLLASLADWTVSLAGSRVSRSL